MEYVETDMLETCHQASKFLVEDKLMKQQQEEQEALRIAQEMIRMASVGNECVSLYHPASRVLIRSALQVC